MTHEKQRIALGKICGWFVAPKHWEHNGNLYPYIDTWINPRNRDFDFMPAGQMVGSLPPDYRRSLDVVAEAEKTCEDMERYYCTLATVVSGKTCYKVSEAHHEKVFVATAAQRAEAVLRYHGQEYDSREV